MKKYGPDISIGECAQLLDTLLNIHVRSPINIIEVRATHLVLSKVMEWCTHHKDDDEDDDDNFVSDE
ncbi:hypothetical protein N0V90_007462 [Kalmusia sp. IMI 367209]|nr:hypothetical protein N0V90_007462 [Kalmusia sp. IMI 367209]